MYHRMFYDYRWNEIIDAESGMDDIKYKNCAQQTHKIICKNSGFCEKKMIYFIFNP